MGHTGQPEHQCRRGTWEKVPEPAVTQKRWYVTGAWSISTVERWAVRVARADSAHMTPNECRGRIEGILLQRCRIKPTEEDVPRGGRTMTKSVPMELEKPTGPAAQHGAAAGQCPAKRYHQYWGHAIR